MGKLLEKLKHTCPRCRVQDFAERINARYPRFNKVVYLWECPSCHFIWRDVKAEPKTEETGKEYAILRRGGWKEALQISKDKDKDTEISL